MDDSKKSESANIKEKHTNRLRFDGNGNWLFFENILNLKDPSQTCTYDQFICFLSLFNNYCQNTFDVSDPRQWAIVKSFYENWINKQ